MGVMVLACVNNRHVYIYYLTIFRMLISHQNGVLPAEQTCRYRHIRYTASDLPAIRIIVVVATLYRCDRTTV